MKGPSLVDGIPPWRREKRQPTRAELAAKHIADGGGVGTSGGNSLPDDESEGTEYELVPLSESSPHVLIRRPKAAPAIKLRKITL